MIKTVFLSSILYNVLIISCLQAQTFQKVKDQHFALEVPTYLSADFELNDQASMQLANTQKEIYLIVIEDEKTNLNNPSQDLSTYHDFVVKQLTSAEVLQEVSIDNPKNKRINGLKAMQSVITATFNERFKICYIATAIESKTRFYQVIIWTLESQKTLYNTDIERMVDSFEEL